MGQKMLARQAHRAGLNEQQLAVPDGSLRVWVGGQGPPVLLLHGFGGDGLGTWRRLAAALADTHQVIVPDLLWFGGSDSQAAPTLAAERDAQIALLDALGVERAAVVGISYGGFVALDLASAAPQRVERLVIVDSPGPVFTPEDEAAMLSRLGISRAQDLFLPDDPDDVKALLALTYVDPPWVPRFALKDLQKHMFSQHHDAQDGLLNDLHARREQVDWDLAALPPTLVVWGEEDPVFPLEVGVRLATAIGAPIHVIPDTAHGPLIEAPEEFNAVVQGFLDAPDPTAQALSPSALARP